MALIPGNGVEVKTEENLCEPKLAIERRVADISVKKQQKQ